MPPRRVIQIYSSHGLFYLSDLDEYLKNVAVEAIQPERQRIDLLEEKVDQSSRVSALLAKDQRLG